MSVHRVHQCQACDQHYCTDCEGISECPLCGNVYCVDCLVAHLDDSAECMMAAKAESRAASREEEE